MNGFPAISRMTLLPWRRPQAAALGSVLKQRLVGGFYGMSLGLALPLAVFTCNGLLGLLVHAIALSGTASLLEKTARKTIRTCPESYPGAGETK